MGAELWDHLGYEAGEVPPAAQHNRRNGASAKTLITEQGAVPIEIPRDRAGSFEPQIVAKHQRRFDGFDDKIIALYAGGMTTRQIEAQLRDLYGVEVGRDLISRVTDAVLDDVAQWQSRPLERLYPIVWMDALVVKIRDQGRAAGAPLARRRQASTTLRLAASSTSSSPRSTSSRSRRAWAETSASSAPAPRFAGRRNRVTRARADTELDGRGLDRRGCADRHRWRQPRQ
jgi:hypothetical protein